MPIIIGYLVSLVCVFGVFILHGGNIGVVLKALPFEMATIGGAALGAFVINNQPKVLKSTMKELANILKGSKYTKARYLELMAMLYEILQKARKEGLMAIEGDVEALCLPLFVLDLFRVQHIEVFLDGYLKRSVYI